MVELACGRPTAGTGDGGGEGDLECLRGRLGLAPRRDGPATGEWVEAGDRERNGALDRLEAGDDDLCLNVRSGPGDGGCLDRSGPEDGGVDRSRPGNGGGGDDRSRPGDGGSDRSCPGDGGGGDELCCLDKVFLWVLATLTQTSQIRHLDPLDLPKGGP